MSYTQEKNRTRFSSSPVSFNNRPSRRTSRSSGLESLLDYEKKDAVYKRYIRILRFFSRFASLLLNGYMMGSQAFVLAKYFLTKNLIIAGDIHPWATPTTLWPTIMMLAISTITFVLNLITLCSYICGVGAANKTSSFASIVGYVMLAARAVVWAVAMGLFKLAHTGNDLWGFSCGGEADAIQKQVRSFLDFGKLCTLQTGTWYASIIETVTYLMTFIVTILMVRRASQKKKIARVRESILMESGYKQNTQGIEMETSYKPRGGRTYMPVSTESPHF